jgi:hypothetical protein
MTDADAIDHMRQALHIEHRQTPGPTNGNRLGNARRELVEGIFAVKEHYSLSDAEVVMLLAQALQEYATRVGCVDIAEKS